MITKLIFVASSIFGFLWVIDPVKSQIIPDDTTNTSITNNCQSVCNITGGEFAEQNLFHSFSEFNIEAGASVYFDNPGVANIFSRVTGNNASEISGILGVSGGNANLWFLNPNGIIFGAGAALDVGGSFVATTADDIQFGDDNSFSALPANQENLALLTVDPTALFFNQMGQNYPISLDSGALLTVAEQQNISLIGAQAIDNEPGIGISNSSFLQAPQGNIAIASLRDGGKIDLDNNFQFSFSDDVARGDISLTQQSGIDVSGVGGGNIFLEGDNIILSGESNLYGRTRGHIDGGKINVLANNLTIAGNSTVYTDTIGAGKSPQINIDVQESINLIGRDSRSLQQLFSTSLSQLSSSIQIDSTGINSISFADGTSGNITIQSKDLNLSDGAWILATTTGTKQGGGININAEQDITLDGSGLLTAVGIGSTGNAGALNINSENLFMQNGSVISSSTLGEGNGGNINLNVNNLIKLRQSLFDGVFPTSIFSNTILGKGAAGNITVDTNQLTLEDGAEISSSSGSLTNNGSISFGGHGGNITVDAADSIQIRGASPDNRFPSGIINSTFSDRSAGDITISTGKLNLQDEAVVSALSLGIGAGGDLTILAEESIHLNGVGFENLQNIFRAGLRGNLEVQNLTGGLLTNTIRGESGNTTINSPSLVLENGALISTSTLGSATGGNIEVISQDIKVASSLLASSATGTGRAGNITIETDTLTTTDSGLITTSSSELGDAGNLKIDANDSIKLIDVNNTSLIFGGLATNSLGLSYPGNIEINTGELTIRGGAKISASNNRDSQLLSDDQLSDSLSIEEFQLQPSKNIIINAESIDISGTSDHKLFTSSINSATYSSFPASNVEINTSELTISDKGAIEVSSFGEGKAGNLHIATDSIFLNSQGALNASTISGQGGNIELQVKDILSLNNSQIQTDALDFGDGGNIDIETNFVVATEESQISANALSGRGGNININATDLFIAPDSAITASSDSKLGGVDGEISIRTFNTSNRNNLVKLPETTIKADASIVKSCGGNRKKKGNFSYVGKGGVPPSLLTEYYVGDHSLIPDFSLDEDESLENKELNLNQAKIESLPKATVEASEWKLNDKGNVELVAQIKRDAISKMFDDSKCPWLSYE